MQQLSLSAVREVPVSVAKVSAAIEKPAEYPLWIPGVAGVKNVRDDGSFECAFRFAIFSLNFKVDREIVDETQYVFRTKAIVVGNVVGTLALQAVDAGTTSITVSLEGAVRAKSLANMANTFFERAADVICARLVEHVSA